MDQEKQKYINENIIEKGYNPEDLSNYIARTQSMPMENLPFSRLKEMVNAFKNEQLKLSIYSVKKPKERKKSEVEILYEPCEYNIKTDIQSNNKLLELEKEKKKINIIVKEPKKESRGFFSQKLTTFIISCEELNSNVKRSLEDIIWFKVRINQFYPFILVPPVINNSTYVKNIIDEKKELEIKCEYVKLFFKAFLRKKILRTSKMFYLFLTLSEKEFEQYKKEINENKFNLNVTLDNLKTMKGEVKINLNDDLLYFANNIIKIVTPTKELFPKLISNLKLIIDNFSNISSLLKETSEIFFKLTNEAQDLIQNEEVLKTYSKLNAVFNYWSDSLISQNNFIEKYLLQNFDYMNMEFAEFDVLNAQYDYVKSSYETYSNKLMTKKNELFQSKNFSKWELDSNFNEKELTFIQNDKEKAFEVMCYNETQIMKYEKLVVTLCVNRINEQFKKLKKYQGERIIEIYDILKNKSKELNLDSINLMKLI
jgi:hypothetical protein